MNTFYFHFFHNFLFHFFLGSSTENLHQFWGKHKLRHFSATRHRTAYLWRQIREIGAEDKNIARFQWCRAFTFPILLQGQFSEKDVEEEQDFVKNVSPHPLRWGLFGSCPFALWRRSLLEKWQYLCPLLFTGQYLCFLENNPHLTCNIHRDKPPSNPLENEKLIPNVFASVELWEFENEFYCYLNVFDPLRKVFHFIRCLWSLKVSFCISNNSQ